MDRFILHNESIIDSAHAGLAPTIAGVVYGWGVFTNLRVYKGSPFAFERHWERLSRHAEKARVPVHLDPKRAALALAGLIETNSVRNGRARLMILKGEEGLWRRGLETESQFLAFTAQEAGQARSDLAMTLSPYRILSSSPLAGVKQTAMLESFLAFEEARSRGFGEAVMLNERGEVVGATGGNIFWVEGDELITPSIGSGCVAGITRSLVHEITKKVNIHLIEGGYPVQRLLDASEVFITSSLREIAPVASFDIKRYDRKRASITRNISREFQKLISDARIEP